MSSWPTSGSWPNAGNHPTIGSWPTTGNWPASDAQPILANMSGAGSIGERALGELSIGEAPLIAASGPIIVTRSSQQAWYWDNNGKGTATGTPPNDYFQRNPFARVVIQTDVSFNGQLPIGAVPSAALQDDSSLSIRVDGAFNQTLPYDIANLNVNQLITVNVPPGAHTIEIEEGSVNGAIHGCSITSLKFPGALILPSPPARRLAWYGDSISDGNFAVPRTLGFLMQLRHGSRFDGVTNLGYAGLAAWNRMSTSGARSALVAELASALDGTVENVATIALITNDYTNNLWSPSAFATDLGLFADAFHAAKPSASLNICSLFAQAAVTNAGGFSPSDYNTAVLAVANDPTRTGWCRGIDCSSFFLLSDTIDGTHPNTVGHAKAYAAFNAIL